MHGLRTVIVAPLTSKGFDLPFRPKILFQEKEGLVLLDQIRTVDKRRLVKKIGQVEPRKAQEIAALLVEMFAW
jgi:mRNA interferase MazF